MKWYERFEKPDLRIVFAPTLTWNNDRSLYAKLAFDEVSTVFDDIIIFAKFCISLELFNLANM